MTKYAISYDIMMFDIRDEDRTRVHCYLTSNTPGVVSGWRATSFPSDRCTEEFLQDIASGAVTMPETWTACEAPSLEGMV